MSNRFSQKTSISSCRIAAVRMRHLALTSMRDKDHRLWVSTLCCSQTKAFLDSTETEWSRNHLLQCSKGRTTMGKTRSSIMVWWETQWDQVKLVWGPRTKGWERGLLNVKRYCDRTDRGRSLISFHAKVHQCKYCNRHLHHLLKSISNQMKCSSSHLSVGISVRTLSESPCLLMSQLLTKTKILNEDHTDEPRALNLPVSKSSSKRTKMSKYTTCSSQHP